MYHMSRAEWMNEKFAKEFPNEKTYRHSLPEEAESLHTAAQVELDLIQSGKVKVDALDPSVAALLKLQNEGLVEAYVLFEMPDQGIIRDYAGYRKDHRDKLKQYLEEYVVPEKPAAP
jgi:hypothetical protein